MSRSAVLEQFRASFPVIAPSMLKCDFGNLHREIDLLESAGAGVLHLDVMDGHFVPNLSYGPMVISRIRRLTKCVLDAHLMISNPQRYLEEYRDAGCDAITVHIEAVSDPLPVLKRIRDMDLVAGLALNPKTPVDVVEPALSECDLILVMSVEPGFGGQQFIRASLEKLKTLSQRISAETILSVDGGIGPATIGESAQAGANLFVSGSSIFEASDYRTAMEDMKNIARENSQNVNGDLLHQTGTSG
jgi:ribulose-phosphate 3-epimerase